MFLVDTNILVYGANEDAEEYQICRGLLREWCGQLSIWHITWGIVYEFLRIVTHPRVFSRPWSSSAAWEFVEALLSAPGLSVLTETELHAETAEEFFRQHPFISGNLLFDAHTAILMKEHGIERIYTRDADFHKFSSVHVVDPLK